MNVIGLNCSKLYCFGHKQRVDNFSLSALVFIFEVILEAKQSLWDHFFIFI